MKKLNEHKIVKKELVESVNGYNNRLEKQGLVFHISNRTIDYHLKVLEDQLNYYKKAKRSGAKFIIIIALPDKGLIETDGFKTKKELRWAEKELEKIRLKQSKEVRK